MKLAAAAFLAILAASCAAPSGDLPRFHEVDPGKVYRSAQPTEAGYQAMAKIGIRTVVKLNTDLLEEERAWAAAAGIRLVEVPLPGLLAPGESDENHVQMQINDSSLQPILFHCEQGQDRTGLVAALYRVNVQGWTTEAAHKEFVDFGHSSFLRDMDDYFWAHVPRSENGPNQTINKIHRQEAEVTY